MSHVAIAAALALENVSAGERLAAFSLASFANREHRAWPGTRVAAARAGLSRSQYLAARDGLEKRGLVAVEESGGGRGHSPVVVLQFAHTGPWCEAEINAPLFEATLGYSRTKGSARLLLATLAALAGDQLEVSALSTDEIRAAAGMADSTYRRARAALLASGELGLVTAGGGRARTNRWMLRDPRSSDGQPAIARGTRVAPDSTARPLIAVAKESEAVAADRETARDAETVKGPGSSGVSELNPAQDRTVSPESPPQTPPQTPPPNARAGREPRNPGTKEHPPSPPEGGTRPGSITIVEDYVTERGRTRQRTVTVELDAIRAQLTEPSTADGSDWRQIRASLERVTGEQTFAIWLAPLELLATDQANTLLLTCPALTRAWVARRFGRVLEQAGRAVGRELRLASERELPLLDALRVSTAICFSPSAAIVSPRWWP